MSGAVRLFFLIGTVILEVLQSTLRKSLAIKLPKFPRTAMADFSDRHQYGRRKIHIV